MFERYCANSALNAELELLKLRITSSPVPSRLDFPRGGVIAQKPTLVNVNSERR